MVPERIYDLLLNARTADKATIRFKDGRIVQGALIFNPFKGTGRLINVDRETSVDFSVDDIRDLKLTPTTVEPVVEDEGAAESPKASTNGKSNGKVPAAEAAEGKAEAGKSSDGEAKAKSGKTKKSSSKAKAGSK